MARKFIKPGQKVLDVACGIGNQLMATCIAGGIPIDIDLSPKANGICKQNTPDGDIYSGPAESLPINNTFDAITCPDSLAHLLDPGSAIEEMVRVSEAGALYIILVPDSGLLTLRHSLYEGTHQVAAKEEARSLESTAA